MNTQEKLLALREKMAQAAVKALYIGTTDPHQSESVAAHWKSVQWLTGFTGSMGYAIVTADDAQFWTDGRYSTQAEREIAPGTFHVNTIATPGTPTWNEWLMVRMNPGDTLSVDGEVMSEAMLRSFKKQLPVPNLQILHERNFVGEIWADRPLIPTDPVWELEEPWATRSRKEKLQDLRASLSKFGPKAVTLVNCLDDIAWLTNLRGKDNPLYPFFHAYALISLTEAHLCTDLNKFSSDIQSKLTQDGWLLHDYDAITGLVKSISSDSTVYTDPFKTPFGLFEAIPAPVAEGPDLVTALKALKNPKEQENIREANRREAAAVVRLMRWIESNVASGSLDEYQVGQKLEEFRRLDPLYIQPANIPIVGYGANAALPHYRPNKTTSSPIKSSGFLLFDICAQYYCGTTDLTRTVAVGALTEEMKKDYTITLRSHIALARQKFPYGVTGNLLDAIVKSLHWNNFRNFGHGTGHGIGYVLNVHDGPGKIIIEYAPAFPHALNTPLEAGMLFSDEPGVYKPGRHGIRIENSVLVQNVEKNEFGRFLGFETVTFLPYERKAIILEDLTPEERSWIDDYHAEVYKRISPLLNEEEQLWLKVKTEPL